MTPFGETFQKTFDKHKSLLQESLDWKDVPVEVKDEVYRKVKEHNVKTDPSIKGFYAIDVTGKYQVYYTFWRFTCCYWYRFKFRIHCGITKWSTWV